MILNNTIDIIRNLVVRLYIENLINKNLNEANTINNDNLLLGIL